MGSKYIPGSGPGGAKLMVVGEAAGEEEERLGKVLVGPTGKETERLFNQAGSSLSQCWITNVIKYHPPDNNLKRLGELTDSNGNKVTLESQQDYLWKEIEAVNPNAILTLGNLPLATLTGKTGISKWRGSLLLCRLGIKVIPTIHPASYLRHGGPGSTPYSARVYIQKDIERAIHESYTRDLVLPQRTVDIARSLIDVIRFFDVYKNEKEWAIDIETANCVPTCIAFAPNPNHAISIPLLHENHFRIPHSELVQIWLFLLKFFSRTDIKYIFQNGKFDHDKIEEVLGILLKGQVYIDTMLLAKVLHPELPGSLAWITSVYTREPYYKDEGRNFDPKKDKPEQFHVYNGKDSCVTKESAEQMLPYLKEYGLEDYFFNFKMPQHNLYMKMERRGFRINEKLRQEKIREYDIKAYELEYILYNIAGREFNANSPQQVKKILFEDLKLPVREGTDEDTLTALLSNHAKSGRKRDFIVSLLELRSVNKVRGATYLRSDPDYDGRARSSWKISGTENDRSSTTKLDEPLRPTESGWAAQTLSKHSDIGGDLCEIIEPDPGYEFVNADLSQAEARVVARLANDEETLALFNKTDIHRKTASWLFKCDPRDVSEELRFVGKAQPLTSKILTPLGWIKMGDVELGDIICSIDGSWTKVTGVYPQGIKDIYEITFSDGSKTRCTREHLWSVSITSNGITSNKFYVKELRDLIGTTKTIAIPNHDSIEFASNYIPPIDPYCLGLLIGDGGFTKPYSISFASIDSYIVDQLKQNLNHNINHSGGCDYYISASLKPILQNLGLWGKYSHEKFIPEEYKWLEVSDRLALLQGLLDTDGTVNNRGNGIEYSTSSPYLRDDVIDLVRSLGGIASYTQRVPKYKYKGEIKEGKISYRVFITINMCPFRLPRKANLWRYSSNYKAKRVIKSIELIGKEESQCISVAHSNHLYITDDFIVTHNTVRHAGNYGMGKHRLMQTVAAGARRFKIDILVSEYQAGKILETFHAYTPKIKGVYHAEIERILNENNRIIVCPSGFRRQFFARPDYDMVKEALALIPQNTVRWQIVKAMLEIEEKHPWIELLMETHDAFLAQIPIGRREEAYWIIKKLLERPISFSRGSMPRPDLVIPCDIAFGENYKALKKVKYNESALAVK